MPRSLEDWLRHYETLHPRPIDMGLERVGEVWRRLGSPRPAPMCIVVGGTNGKGSTVAYLEACLRAAGHRVGTYTSPHLLRYNERIRIGAVDVADAALCSAFGRLEEARGEIALTYFEAGTLAAFVLMAQAGLDAAVLEIGLGGRLDAVNLIDGDAAILTSVDLDHMDYLGPTREHIGAEKAWIFRPARPAILAEPDPPASVLAHAQGIATQLRRVPEITAQLRDEWTLPLPDGQALSLPPPGLRGPSQRRNAAGAALALWTLRQRWHYSVEALAAGISGARAPGRLQRLPLAVEAWADVAHNPESARELAGWLMQQGKRRTIAVYAALADKDLAAIVEPLLPLIDGWVLHDLRPSSPRAAEPRLLRALLPKSAVLAEAPHMPAALASAANAAGAQGRVLVFGSFLTVADALKAVQASS
jgi:dihydrofolate synthase/folylpolyglutamate synthase